MDLRFIWALYKQQKISDKAACDKFVGARAAPRRTCRIFDAARPLRMHCRSKATGDERRPIARRSLLILSLRRKTSSYSSCSSLGSVHMQLDGRFAGSTCERLRVCPPPSRSSPAVSLGGGQRPAKLGKTERPAHWFGTLVLNAQNITTPCLRELNQGDGPSCTTRANGVPPQRSARCFSPHRDQWHWGNPTATRQQTPWCCDFWGGCTNLEARSWVQDSSVFVNITQPAWEEH